MELVNINLRTRIAIILTPLTLLVVLAVPVMANHTPAHTACQGINNAGDTSCDNLEGAKSGINETVKSVINILLYAVGIVAVIMLIIGAVKYVVSGGDQQAVASAKNTIIYSIVGIVIAIMAFAIVNFVLGRVTTPTAGGIQTTDTLNLMVQKSL